MKKGKERLLENLPVEGAAGAVVTGVAVTAPPPKVKPDEAGAAAEAPRPPPPPPKLNPVVAALTQECSPSTHFCFAYQRFTYIFTGLKS